MNQCFWGYIGRNGQFVAVCWHQCHFPGATDIYIYIYLAEGGGGGANALLYKMTPSPQIILFKALWYWELLCTEFPPSENTLVHIVMWSHYYLHQVANKKMNCLLKIFIKNSWEIKQNGVEIRLAIIRFLTYPATIFSSWKLLNIWTSNFSLLSGLQEPGTCLVFH